MPGCCVSSDEDYRIVQCTGGVGIKDIIYFPTIITNEDHLFVSINYTCIQIDMFGLVIQETAQALCVNSLVFQLKTPF